MLKCTGHYGTPEKIEADVHVIFFVEDEQLFKKITNAFCAEIKDWVATLSERGDFRGKSEETVSFVSGTRYYVLSGLGPIEGFSPEALRRAAARAMKEAAKYTVETVALYCLQESVYKRTLHFGFEAMVEAILEGALLAHYKFDRYISKTKEEAKRNIKELHVVTAEEGFQNQLKNAIVSCLVVIEAVYFARDLTNSPPNELTPADFAAAAVQMAEKLKLKHVVLGKKDIELAKMGGLLAVNRGSKAEPKFIIIEYNETKRKLPLYALVGKGVTFDSGGLSLKPAASMEEMKMDMAGGAAVLGVIQAVAKMKLPVRLVGLIPATDNMIGGGALCPGDIIRMSNGKTVEVLNTDAEGRLILADALVYAQRYKADGIIDIATLTGAVAVALASHATGMMGTSAEMMEQLKAAGEQTYDRVWELPLFPEYEKMMKGTISDLKNLGAKWGGAITAAAFLKQFVGTVPWVHLDIAGTGMLDEAGEYCTKGGSGAGVRLLTEFFRTIAPPEK